MTSNLKALMYSCDHEHILRCSVVAMLTGNTEELEAFNHTTGNLFLVPEPALGDMPRTWRLAHLRNLLIDTIFKNPSFAAFPYIAMVDLDGVVSFDGNWVLQAIRDAIQGVHVAWNALTFNADQYYDLWALRCNLNSPNCRGQTDSWWNCINDEFFPCMGGISALQPDQTLQVASAFNGLGLYKTNLIGDCRYYGKDQIYPDKEECEHVPFHRCLLDNRGASFITGIKLPIHYFCFYAGKNYHSFEDFRAEVSAAEFNSSALLKVNCAMGDENQSLADKLGLGNLTEVVGFDMDLDKTFCA